MRRHLGRRRARRRARACVALGGPLHHRSRLHDGGEPRPGDPHRDAPWSRPRLADDLLGARAGAPRRGAGGALFRFDPALRLMSTVDDDGGRARRARQGRPRGRAGALHGDRGARTAPAPLDAAADACRWSAALRVLAVAGRRRVADGRTVPRRRARGGRARPRPARAGRAGRPAAPRGRRRGRPLPRGRASAIIVVTGDNGPHRARRSRAASASLRGEPRIVTGAELDAMSDARARPAPPQRARSWSSPAPRPRPSCASPTPCARRATSSR